MNLFMKRYCKDARMAMLSCMAVLVASCSNRGQSEAGTISNVEYTFEDFETVQIDSLKGTLVSDDVDFGFGADIKVINDSIIAVRVIRSPYQVVLLNLSSGKKQTAVSTGAGPLEMIRVSSLSANDGVLWLLGSSDNKVMTATWSDTDDMATVTPKYVAKGRMLNGIVDSKGRVIGLPMDPKNVRACITDTTGNITTTFGAFPAVEMPDSVSPDNSMFQSNIAYNAKYDKAIIANRSWNIIEIYDFADSTCLNLIGPDKMDSKIEVTTTPNVMMFDQKPLWLYLSGVSAGSESFCVGYVGVKVTCKEDYQRKTNSILEFDYNGKPLRRYKFDNDLMSFDIDFKNRIIYTIELQDDPVIKKYSL